MRIFDLSTTPPTASSHRAKPLKEYDIPKIQEIALDTIRQSVIIVDGNLDDWPIIYSNAAFEKLTGYAPEEVIGRNCRFLSGPDTSLQMRAEIKAALKEGAYFSGVMLNYRKDGSAFWNELSISPVEQEGAGHFFVGVQVDVTQRMELGSRLREAQRMEAIGKLSGGIAHDFNNLLALILGNAEMIVSEAAKGSLTREAAGDIVDATESGSELVSRLLRYARGDAGEPEDVAVNAAIEHVLGLLTRTIGDSIQLETDLSPAVGRVKIDRSLFETSILNLVLNARDAMPHGGVIRIGTRRRANSGPTLGQVAVVTVADTGHGMDQATVSRAFEPFFTTKQAGRGNGLGLATVYNFVKQSGGDIHVESKVGEGTTVTMLLAAEEQMLHVVRPAPELWTVLLVEDDAKLRRMLSHQLVRNGYTVDEAASVEEALDLIDGGAVPAMLISDIRLKGRMSGLELIELIRQRRLNIPMLLMTAFAEELEEHSATLDNVPVLRKPFRNAELLAEVGRMTGKPKKSREDDASDCPT